jgi:hypothetical protein
MAFADPRRPAPTCLAKPMPKAEPQIARTLLLGTRVFPVPGPGVCNSRL